jgi:hypothetical protein
MEVNALPSDTLNSASGHLAGGCSNKVTLSAPPAVTSLDVSRLQLSILQPEEVSLAMLSLAQSSSKTFIVGGSIMLKHV